MVVSVLLMKYVLASEIILGVLGDEANICEVVVCGLWCRLEREEGMDCSEIVFVFEAEIPLW